MVKSLTPESDYRFVPQSPNTKKKFFVLGLCGIFVGVGLRLWIMLTPSLAMISSDIAVVGLEASRMMQGHFQPFYWGQFYGGTIETSLVALAFSIFSYSITTLSMVPMVLDFIGVILLWRIARYFLTELEAIAGSICFWVAPASYVWWSTKEVGFYWVTMDLGLSIVLLATRLVFLDATKQNQTGENSVVQSRKIPEQFEWGLVGLLIGLGWWSSPDIMYFLIPTSLWMLIKRPNALLRLPIIVPGVLIGAFPWLLSNYHTKLASLKIPPMTAPNNSYLDHLYSFFNGDLPVALGLRVPYQDYWIIPDAKLFYFFIALPLLAIGLVIVAKRFTLVAIVATLYPFILAISPFSWWVGEARYAIFLSPFLALLITVTLYKLGKGLLLGTGIVAMVALSITGLSMMSTTEIVPMNFSMKQLEKTLYSHHIHYAYSNYWIAYRLIFETHSKIIVFPTSVSRYSRYDKLVNTSPNPARIFVKGALRTKVFISDMSKAGVSFATYPAGHFVVYQPLESSPTVKSIEQIHFGKQP